MGQHLTSRLTPLLSLTSQLQVCVPQLLSLIIRNICHLTCISYVRMLLSWSCGKQQLQSLVG